MKKILFFIRSLGSGGAERQLLITAKGLAERGYEVIILTFYNGGFYENQISGTNIHLLSLNKKGRWDLVAFFCRLVSVLRKEIPDVVYSFLGTANIFLVLTRPFLPHTKIIWGVRSSNMNLGDYDRAARWSYWLECRLACFADLIVVNSSSGQEYSVENGFPEGKMVLIANGIDTEHFRPDKTAGENFRKTWGIKKHERLIGLIGRIDPMKDHSTFLRAAVLIRRKFPNIRFIFVGKGEELEYENTICNLAKKLGLDDVLIWTGEQADMLGVYNALDIASSSSSYGEGFPNVIGEAMSCGVLCQVTNVGDSALVVGEVGWVVPPDDYEVLSSAWAEMLSLEISEFEAISISSRERVLSEFSIAGLLDSTEKLLAEEIECIAVSKNSIRNSEANSDG
jgi:glycosyltransferase involved in cell wall biosynthesis